MGWGRGCCGDVPKGAEVTILAGTRTSGDNRREEKRERQRWEKAGEVGALWDPMSRSPLELSPGITHSNQAGGQLFYNTDTQPDSLQTALPQWGDLSKWQWIKECCIYLAFKVP